MKRNSSYNNSITLNVSLVSFSSLKHSYTIIKDYEKNPDRHSETF